MRLQAGGGGEGGEDKRVKSGWNGRGQSDTEVSYEGVVRGIRCVVLVVKIWVVLTGEDQTFHRFKGNEWTQTRF